MVACRKELPVTPSAPKEPAGQVEQDPSMLVICPSRHLEHAPVLVRRYPVWQWVLIAVVVEQATPLVSLHGMQAAPDTTT